jgi:hypothetical protein
MMNKNTQTPRPPAPGPGTAVPPPVAPSTQVAPVETVDGHRLPDAATLQHAVKLAIVEDKQIMMDYWTQSIDKTVLIGVKENKEKLLVKSEEEYTSPIAKIYKLGNEFVIVTENSIYIVDVGIPTKRISSMS